MASKIKILQVLTLLISPLFASNQEGSNFITVVSILFLVAFFIMINILKKNYGENKIPNMVEQKNEINEDDFSIGYIKNNSILIDTSIAVEGGEAIIAKLAKIAPIFVTDIVLQELDGHKNNANSSVAFQAREFFRRLGRDNGVELRAIPLSNILLEKTDTLRKMTLGNTPLHVIVRKPYKTRDINDSKIIEIAKDYNMTLVTLDMAQRVRAMSDGVDSITLNQTSNVSAIAQLEKDIERKNMQTDKKPLFSLEWGNKNWRHDPIYSGHQGNIYHINHV